jgi:hypothetical protein
MQLASTRARSCNADVQRPTFQPHRDIAGNNANQNFNQRDRNSCPDQDQTRKQRKPHPNRSDKPDIFEHNKTPSCLEGVISSRGFPSRRFSVQTANSIACMNSIPSRLYINPKLTKCRRQPYGRKILCRQDRLHHKNHILKRSPK